MSAISDDPAVSGELPRSPPRPTATSVVFRLAWSSRHTSLLSSALLRDHFLGVEIPPPNKPFIISLLDLTNATLETIAIQPEDALDLHGGPSTKTYLLPPLPPSLQNDLHNYHPGDFQHGESLTETLQLSLQPDARTSFLNDLSIPPPTVTLLHGPYSSGKTSLATWISRQTNANLLRIQSSTLLQNAVTADGMAAALQYYTSAAMSACPAVLLLDDAQFLFPVDDARAASAFVIAADKVRGHKRLSFIIAASPGLESLHAAVVAACDLVQRVELDACGDWSVSFAAARTGLSPKQAEAGLLNANVTSMKALLQWVGREHVDDNLEFHREEPISEKERCRRMEARWSDIGGELGGLSEPRRILKRVLLWRQTKREEFETLHVTPGNGVLLYGSPGTGKTALVRQAAAACEFRVVVVDAAMLARGEVGESERILSRTFEEAGRDMPCVVFLDEIDALFSTGGGSAPHLTRLVAALALTMDNVGKDVVVIGATNRPWAVSKALLRAGRFEHCVKVSLPDSEERREIAAVYAEKMELREESRECLEELVAGADGFSGADIAGACRRAAMKALGRESAIEGLDFRSAFSSMEASVKKEDAGKIETWRPPF